jgi:hypothetical protein
MNGRLNFIIHPTLLITNNFPPIHNSKLHKVGGISGSLLLLLSRCVPCALRGIRVDPGRGSLTPDPSPKERGVYVSVY